MNQNSKREFIMKIFRWLALTFFLGIPSYIALNYIYLKFIADFRFEQFSKAEDLQKYLDQRFLGKDGLEMKQVMEKSGAECNVIPKEAWKFWPEDLPNRADIPYNCKYVSCPIGINSWNKYDILFFIDKEKKVLKILTGIYGIYI